MLWTRNKPNSTTPASSRLVGVEMNATRLRMIHVANGTAHTHRFEDHAELPLSFLLDGRKPGLGNDAVKACRVTPHLVCSNFLAQLGQAREWRGPRIVLTPESAIAAVFESLQGTLNESFVLALPAYLSPSQIKTVTELAAKAKLPLKATACSALAIAAHRAEAILTPKAITEEHPEWVVPMKPPASGPGCVVIIDADDFALNAAIIEVTPTEVKLLSQAAWPRASLKLWKDRLLDSISDRCVRLCRRDPRDSAIAEQGLYDQLDDALEKCRLGHAVTLTARSDHWHQEIVLHPADFDAFSATLLKTAGESLHELITTLTLPGPPKSVWLSPTAAKLPGLAAMVYEQSPEGTDVSILPADAGAEAAAALLARVVSGALPNAQHWGTTIPVSVASKMREITPPAAAKRG
ncbi:hypothetical protein BH11PLA2_BH11PLA2_05710 [soil metagenome]